MGRQAMQALRGTFRDLNTGVNPDYTHPLDADAALDQAGDPGHPIDTRIEGGGASVLPWWDAFEDPAALPDLPSPNLNMTAEPTARQIGAKPIIGAYEGAVRTRGPVYQWGHEPSGGLQGDQATGRIMRFPANIPDRYDPNGVQMPSYSDELAAAIATNGAGIVSADQVTTEMITLPGVYG